MLTVAPHHHRGRRAEYRGVGHHVSHYTRVIPRVWGFNFGYVQVARPLGDETAGVLLEEVALAVENPGIFDLCREKTKNWNYVPEKILNKQQ